MGFWKPDYYSEEYEDEDIPFLDDEVDELQVNMGFDDDDFEDEELVLDEIIDDDDCDFPFDFDTDDEIEE
jgi:hypothetical protein